MAPQVDAMQCNDIEPPRSSSVLPRRLRTTVVVFSTPASSQFQASSELLPQVELPFSFFGLLVSLLLFPLFISLSPFDLLLLLLSLTSLTLRTPFASGTDAHALAAAVLPVRRSLPFFARLLLLLLLLLASCTITGGFPAASVFRAVDDAHQDAHAAGSAPLAETACSVFLQNCWESVGVWWWWWWSRIIVGGFGRVVELEGGRVRVREAVADQGGEGFFGGEGRGGGGEVASCGGGGVGELEEFGGCGLRGRRGWGAGEEEGDLQGGCVGGGCRALRIFVVVCSFCCGCFCGPFAIVRVFGRGFVRIGGGRCFDGGVPIVVSDRL